MHNYERAEQEQSKVTVIGQIRAIAFSGWMPGLLMCASVGIALHFAYTNPTARFFVSLVAVVPLAAMLSCATEEFTLKAGEVLGGLLNASVRLVVEMTSSIFALVAHFAKTLLPATALVAMLCYLRQNTRGARPPDRLAVPPGRSRFYDRRRPHTTTPRFGPDDGAYRRLPPSGRHCATHRYSRMRALVCHR
jgi:hypothetical protein